MLTKKKKCQSVLLMTQISSDPDREDSDEENSNEENANKGNYVYNVNATKNAKNKKNWLIKICDS